MIRHAGQRGQYKLKASRSQMRGSFSHGPSRGAVAFECGQIGVERLCAEGLRFLWVRVAKYG